MNVNAARPILYATDSCDRSAQTTDGWNNVSDVRCMEKPRMRREKHAGSQHSDFKDVWKQSLLCIQSLCIYFYFIVTHFVSLVAHSATHCKRGTALQ